MDRAKRQKKAVDVHSNEIPRPPRRRLWWLAFVVVAGGAVAGVSLARSDPTALPAETLPERRLEQVAIRDLIEQESYDGTLGTTAAEPIRSGLSGTVTSAAEPGTTLTEGDVLFEIDDSPVVLLVGTLPAYRELATPDQPTTTGLGTRLSGTVTHVAEPGVFDQGDILYRVDEQPVVLLYGDLPMYRTISDPPRGEVSGADVVQLKEALIALGYDPDGSVSLGETFGGNAEDMVERWQEDIGATVDGLVGVGEVMYAAGPVEVTEFLIELGDVIGAGQAVAEVPDPDEDAEVLEGTDVLQLETALVRLGFDAGGTLTADGVWDEATEAAVIDWQESTGVEPDGVVDIGEVVFLPGPVRVLDQLTTPGVRVGSGGTVLDISSADKLVTMDLPAADQGVIAVGDAVTVELPDGTEVLATVIGVASVASVGANNSTVFEVTIDLDDPSVAARLDEAPVDVLIVTDSALGAMTVPVTALLVLAEGGYAVEVDAGDGTTRLVGVEPGFFAGGLVEVRSGGLRVGDSVVVP